MKPPPPLLPAALAVSLALLGCHRVQPAHPTALRAQPPRTADAGTPASRSTPWLVNALVVSLLDDSSPPRWMAPAAAGCAAGTRIDVDGRTPIVGEAMPAVAFRMRWATPGCRPLGPTGPLFDGTVELWVFHEDDGLSAVVETRALRIDGESPARGERSLLAASMPRHWEPGHEP